MFAQLAKAAAGVAATAAIKMTADRVANTVLDGALLTAQSMLRNDGSKSYVRASASVRVEPFVTMDERFVEMTDISKDVVNLGQRLFTCYYLLAHAAHDIIDGAAISERVSRFNPDRNLMDASASLIADGRRRSNMKLYSSESFSLGLPEPGRVHGLDRFGPLMSDEQFYSVENKLATQVANARRDIEDTAIQSANTSVDTKKAIETMVKETANLAMGQVVDLTVSSNGVSQTVPIHIRLRPLTVPSDVMEGTLSLRGKSYALTERLRAKRVGEIDWKDLIFQTDRVKEYAKLSKKDKSGFFQKTHNRTNKHFIGKLLTGKGSIGEMSSILILARETVIEFERNTGLRLSNFTARQRIMEDTLTMLIMVVDQDFETVQVYLDSIDDNSAEYRISDIKMGGKNDSNDLMKTLSSLIEGRIPGRL